MSNVIEMKNVSKEFKVLDRREGLKGSILDLFSRDYRIVRAVEDISFQIKQREIVGYLGPNGAGKSTTIKMMTGVLEPSSGQILVNGKVPYHDRAKNAQEIGVVFGQRSQLWWSLPLVESFKLLKDIYQVNDKDYKDIMEFYDELVDIKDILHKPIRQMSLGQRTLSDILAAFLHSPKIVFLDEPTIGLDVSMKSKIRKLIKALNKERNTTVILTTHDIGDVDALCERVCIIDKGKLLYDNNLKQLKKVFGAYRTLKLGIHEQTDKLEEELATIFPPKAATLLSADAEWLSIMVNEEMVNFMDVLNYMQEHYYISDMKLEEISTETVIKKIYEEGI